MKLFIDDERTQPEGWYLAKTNREAQRIIREFNKHLTDISFDHDGGEFDFMESVHYLCEQITEGKMRGCRPNITTHSANPVGKRRIIAAFKDVELECKEVNYQ